MYEYLHFVFVLNKMDTSAPEAEDMGKAVESVKEILVSYGIENPHIFPCSAFTALHIRTSLKNIGNKSINKSALFFLIIYFIYVRSIHKHRNIRFHT